MRQNVQKKKKIKAKHNILTNYDQFWGWGVGGGAGLGVGGFDQLWPTWERALGGGGLLPPTRISPLHLHLGAILAAYCIYLFIYPHLPSMQKNNDSNKDVAWILYCFFFLFGILLNLSFLHLLGSLKLTIDNLEFYLWIFHVVARSKILVLNCPKKTARYLLLA